jgi:hypothetical protein
VSVRCVGFVLTDKCKVNETARVVWPANRRRLASVLSETVRNGFGFFEGEKLLSTGDGDTHYNFRQVHGCSLPRTSLTSPTGHQLLLR